MSFGRALTPRNPSFYRSESPVQGFKYRPQSADSVIFPAARCTRIVPSKGGRSQSFILVGKASCTDKHYDCSGVAATRVLENTSNRGGFPAPCRYRPNTKSVVSRSQSTKYLNTITPDVKRQRSKSVHHSGTHIPFTKHKRATVPRFTRNRKQIWFPVGDAKLVKHPGPGTYNIRSGRDRDRKRAPSVKMSTAPRSVSVAGEIKQPLVVIAKSKAIQRRKTRNDPYHLKTRSDWRISKSTSYDAGCWQNSFRGNPS